MAAPTLASCELAPCPVADEILVERVRSGDQDAFGELNDTAVLLGVVESFKEADPAFVRASSDHLARARKSVVRVWRRAEPDLVEMAEKWNCS